MQSFLVGYLIAINVCTMIVFAVDKQKARAGAWRVPEKTLLFLAIVGGSIGALVGMHLFHHKTRKPLFRYGIPLILIVQGILVGVLFL